MMGLLRQSFLAMTQIKVTKKQLKGQVALVVLVVSAIVMTVGLSMSKKSVVETKITTDEELLKQAFNAAESGLENYMGTGSTSYASTDSDSRAVVEVEDIGGATNVINLGSIVLRNTTNFTWLVGHNETTGAIDYGQLYGGDALTVCVTSGFNGSLKVDYFYQDAGGNFGVSRMGYNIGSNDRVNGYTNIASSPVVNCPGAAGMRGVPLSLPAIAGGKPLLLAVKPIAADTLIVVAGNAVFPVQGKELSSTGITGNIAEGQTEAQVSRKIKVFNQYTVPAFMLEAITAADQVLSN